MFVEYLILQKFNELVVDFMDLTISFFMKRKHVEIDWIDFNNKREAFNKMLENYLENKAKDKQHLRDLNFFNYHLSELEKTIKNTKNLDRKKIKRMIDYLIKNDIPGVLRIFSDYEKYFDQSYSFYKDLEPLIIEGKADSAIRDCFVNYSNFLRKHVGNKGINKVDGKDLIVKVFRDPSSKLFCKLDESERVALLSIFTGVYSYVRNSFAHKKTKSDKMTFNFVISSLIWGIKEITEIKKRRKRTIQK